MKSLKVLLVDNKPEFVSTLEERLRLREIEAVVAPDGRIALQMIRENPPT